jgi:pilus assembly protein CpaC
MPGIASIPIIGALFHSKSTQRSTTELLVIVTPHIVDEVSNPDPVPTPPTPARPFLEANTFDKSLTGKK